MENSFGWDRNSKTDFYVDYHYAVQVYKLNAQEQNKNSLK